MDLVCKKHTKLEIEVLLFIKQCPLKFTSSNL